MKKIIFFLIFILLGLVIFVYLFFFKAPKENIVESTETKDNVSIDSNYKDKISFKYQELDCINIYKPKKDLYFVGSSVIDIDNDGKDEFYITTGEGKKDCLFAFIDGKFVNIIENVGIDATPTSYGVFSVDMTNNGFTDLIVARRDGIYLYKNNNGIFTEQLLYNKFEKKSVPVDISVSDYDKDGDIDMYISTFIDAPFFKSASFNNPKNRQKNIFLQNNGGLVFVDVTDKVGLTLPQNTFLSSFIDLNNDNFEDLVLSNNTGQIYIYENNGERFTLRAKPSGFGFWMGMAVSDYNQDGLTDIFLSNVGDTIPRKFLFGDLRKDQSLEEKYIFLRNDGDFNFTNILPEITDETFPFGWGIVSNDFNFDNKDDYLSMHNYIKWIPHKLSKSPGALLVNINNKLEDVINSYGLANDNYGFSSLIGDFNNDRLKDVVYLNIAGPHTIHINTSTTNKDSFVVHFKKEVKYINITTELVFDNEESIVKTLHRKQGIQSTQDSDVIFYYKNKTPKQVNVIAPNGVILSSTIIKKNQTELFIVD